MLEGEGRVRGGLGVRYCVFVLGAAGGCDAHACVLACASVAVDSSDWHIHGGAAQTSRLQLLTHPPCPPHPPTMINLGTRSTLYSLLDPSCEDGFWPGLKRSYSCKGRRVIGGFIGPDLTNGEGDTLHRQHEDRC